MSHAETRDGGAEQLRVSCVASGVSLERERELRQGLPYQAGKGELTSMWRCQLYPLGGSSDAKILFLQADRGRGRLGGGKLSLESGESVLNSPTATGLNSTTTHSITNLSAGVDCSSSL